MIYLSETVAMLFFLLLPALVLAGLFLPERRFNARRVFRHTVFRIETARPAKVVAHDEVVFRHSVFRIETVRPTKVVAHDPDVLRLSAASAIEGIWERHKARWLVPQRMEVFA